MAGATQRSARRRVINPPSSVSDDGTVADTPLSGGSSADNDATQSNSSTPPASTQQGVSDHDEIAPLGANVIEALQIVSTLGKLGLDKQEISLPKCIVLGQQSTGKSSVIEAISGIKTPRDTGTCTRCPLFIELQPTADARASWHASISLLRQYDIDLNPGPRGNDVEFQGWVPAPVPQTMPFAETDDAAELEHLIRCAQRATLSPLEVPSSFLDQAFDDSDIHKTLFSPNVVCITVSKPNLPPLSFFDLPGMIGQAENDEEAFTVPLVEALVTKYIMDPEALILVTCALESDVANSIAAGLAKRKGVTNRCLGVLTKPDRLPAGESPKDLANILDGRRFLLGHGYFVVKNLNSEQIRQGLTHQDARRLETDFFANTVPWSTQLQQYQARFGTLNLQQYLSSQLGNQVLSKLPNIRHQIEDRLANVEAELSRIPDIPPHIAARTIDDLLHAFADAVRNEVAGEYGFMTWTNIWKQLKQSMWDGLLQLKPGLVIKGSLDQDVFNKTLPGQSADDAIPIDSDDDADMSGVPETPSKKRKRGSQTKREEQTSAPGQSPSRTPKKPIKKGVPQPSPIAPASAQSESLAVLQKNFNLDDVRLYLSENSKSRVPGQIDPKVLEELMVSSFKHWPRIICTFFDEFERQLKQRMMFIFNEHFGGWKGSELYSASFAAVEALIDTNLYQQQTTMASESLDDELEGPYIFHEDEFEDKTKATMERYSEVRTNARLRIFLKGAAERYGEASPLADEDKIRKDDKKMSLIRSEPYPHEIQLIAKITTYYMMAAQRFHASVAMRVESKFFRQLRTKLRDQLQDELGIHDAAEGPLKAQRLLAESPERLARRNILVAKKKSLVEGLKCLNEHFQKFQANNPTVSAHSVPSNYRRPAVSTPHGEEMEDVRSAGLPLRSLSRHI